jgi:hypothetical protein
VSLTAIDANGAVTDLGTVTTNGYYGTFSKAWTPTAQGTYTIVASFGADASYGSSSAATAVTIGPAPQAPAQQPQQSIPDYTNVLYAIVAAGIIAILIGVVNLFANFKKRS